LLCALQNFTALFSAFNSLQTSYGTDCLVLAGINHLASTLLGGLSFQNGSGTNKKVNESRHVKFNRKIL
jgi:hypothetical protein